VRFSARWHPSTPGRNRAHAKTHDPSLRLTRTRRCSPESPIADFYPLDFKIDMNGKKNPWEAVSSGFTHLLLLTLKPGDLAFTSVCL
jgi:Xrn1 helical domain